MKFTKIDRHFLREKGIALLALLVWLVWGVGMLTGCAGNPHVVKEFDDEEVEIKGRTTDNGKITLNEENEAKVEVSRTVEFELQVQDMVNMHLQDDVESELFHLKACRTSMADPALGGTGEVAPMPDVDTTRVSQRGQGKEEMGVDQNGDLRIVRKQFLDKRLSEERAYEENMRGLIKKLVPMREDCERKLGYKQRVATK